MIEAGGGRGWLTGWMLDAFSRRYPGLFEAVEAVIIEKNPEAAKKGILPELADKVSFRGDINESTGRFEGVVISNELIDSLPFHRVIKKNGRLKEIYVGIEDGRFIEVEGEPSTKDSARISRGFQPVCLWLKLLSRHYIDPHRRLPIA